MISYPQSSVDDDQMQADDDFDYGGEDQSAPSPQTKSPNPVASEKINKTLSVTGIRGEDVVLKCDVGSNREYIKCLPRKPTNKPTNNFSAQLRRGGLVVLRR